MRHGWVYVMVNASMRNLVKVGRTTREPHLRVAELSSATGVPTPFVLEFGQVYADCARAERQIHGVLDERGLRVNANREFFHGPARDIVSIIMDHAGQEPSWAEPRRLREDLAARAALGHHFCYAEIAILHAARGQATECLRAWDLFFAAHEAATAGGAEEAFWNDPRATRACRRYVACCLTLGTEPGYRPLLLRAADDMVNQQTLDLKRSRGTTAAPRFAAVMRWIYENLAPGTQGTGLPAGADGTDPRRSGPSRPAAA